MNYSNVVLKGAAVNVSDPYNNRTFPAVLGQNFAVGTEDGCGVSGFTEGSLKANALDKAVRATIKEASDWVKVCHTKNKVPILAMGLMEPVPCILSVQVFKSNTQERHSLSWRDAGGCGREQRDDQGGLLGPAYYEGASTLF